MTLESWLLVVIAALVAYYGNKLSEIFTAVEDIQDRLEQVYPFKPLDDLDDRL